jgi:hypothetical protein
MLPVMMIINNSFLFTCLIKLPGADYRVSAYIKQQQQQQTQGHNK